MHTVVDNVWINNEGTVTVERVNGGDTWIHPNHDSLYLHKKHQQEQMYADAARVASLHKGVARSAYTSGHGIPPTPSQLWRDGCYFSPAACGIGGFRGVPVFTQKGSRNVAMYGSIPTGNGEAPAVTRLLQGNWLPSKSIGMIEAEERDFNRAQGAMMTVR